MQGNLLIHGATMILPETSVIGDLRIKNGAIEEILVGDALKPNDDELFIDARGLHLLPGIIDPQCHFRDPGQPEKEDLGSGSAAAVSGGVTSFLDMPNNKPSITDMEGMQGKLDTASQKCVNNYGFFIGATQITSVTCKMSSALLRPRSASQASVESRYSWAHRLEPCW